MRKLFTFLMIVTAMFFSGLMMWGSYYIFAPPWLTYEGAIRVLVPSVRPGQAVPIRVTRCNIRGERGEYDVDRWLVPTSGTPGVVVTLQPSLGISIEPGCRTDDAALSVIPEKTAPGRYFITGTARLRSALIFNTVYWATEPFEVTP